MPIENRTRHLPLPEPRVNFQRGLYEVRFPEFRGKGGKVRDVFEVGDDLLMITTDRQSAYDRVVCTVPGKGQVLNLISAFWFKETIGIVPNHVREVIHPNVLLARKAVEVVPVEFVVRRYMAKSSTPTSVYRNYTEGEGKRVIYGIGFPDGLGANQEFLMGTIVTPTTKAEHGHDEMLTHDQARHIVDSQFGLGMWDTLRKYSLALFEFGYDYSLAKGLMLADTKFEFGIDKDGALMVIDEMFTPDSSRFWKASTYHERLERDENPESFDKEILRRWLAEQGFTGDGEVPVIDDYVIAQMSKAYEVPYELITGNKLQNGNGTAEHTVSDIRRKVIQRYAEDPSSYTM